MKFRDDYSLEKAIQVAQVEDKNIFIDTYAPWCGPCKLMDFQFQDEDLGVFLNKEYINIKINMDSPYGLSVKNRYDVFFLPTLLIVDKYGNVKYSSDGAVTSDELLELSIHFYNEVYRSDWASDHDPRINKSSQDMSSDLTTLTSSNLADKSDERQVGSAIMNPSREVIKSQARVSSYELKVEEKILYTENDKTSDPDFLYNLTYLKLQLQDGTHWAAAENYLQTQEDWSSKKNMKFIYDFVRRPGTRMFQHILDNRVAYETLFGKENVNRSLSIMVNMRLYQSFPRPELKEVLDLFKILDSDGTAKTSSIYLLNRYEEEDDFSQFIPLALKYVAEIDGDDYEMINKIARYYDRSNIALNLNDLITLMEHAIDIQGGTDYVLFDTISKLYQHKGKKGKAIDAINKAIELARSAGVDVTQLIGRRVEILD